MEEVFNLIQQKAKTTCQIAFNCSACANEEPITCTLRGNDKKWVSVEDVRTFFLLKELSLRKEFQELFDTIPIEMEKVGRKYEVYSIGTKKQWIEWLVKYSQAFDETFPQQEQAKVSVDRKQLSDELGKRQKDFDEYERLAHWHKNNATEDDKIARVCWHRVRDEIKFLKELLEGSVPLSPEEIKDIEASEKEFAEGKGKVFENAEDFIADLHETRKKGSVGVEK